MPVDLTSVAGVVSVDFSTADELYRLSTTEVVTGWSVTNGTDGLVSLIKVTLNPGHTMSFDGLVDQWVGDPLTLFETESVYFPIVFDGASVIAQSNNIVGLDRYGHYSSLTTLSVGQIQDMIDAAVFDSGAAEIGHGTALPVNGTTYQTFELEGHGSLPDGMYRYSDSAAAWVQV